MPPRKFIIDADVGLDDASALFLAIAAHKEKFIEIMAITAAQGNTTLDNVMVNIARTLEAANIKNIPVYRGAHSSIVDPYAHEEPFHGWDGFGDAHHDSDPDMSQMRNQEHAVNAMVRIVSQNPGQVTLVAVGPLTNVALAMRMDPSFASNLKDIYIMGGNTEGLGNTSSAAEFNFFCDPDAAYIVLQNVACPTYIAPWELCLHRTKISWDWRNNVMGKYPSPMTALLNKIEAKITANPEADHWVVCDQLAVAAALDKRVIRKQSQQYATVELYGKYARGQMIVDYANRMHKNPNVFIIESIDEELFKSMLMWSLGDPKSTYKLPKKGSA